MAAVNSRRVLLGALVGGVVWNIWSIFINLAITGPRTQAAQEAGYFLRQPRYPMGLFIGTWIVTLFVLSYIVAWLYASARATRGAGAGTALVIGILVGFAAGFPSNFAMSTWGTFSRFFPFWWTMELGGGAILAALVAGFLYKDATAAVEDRRQPMMAEKTAR